MKNIIAAFENIFRFYTEGFKNMTVGKTLWKIIAIKIILFFVVIKLLFFPNFLKENFETDEQRSEHILKQITLQKGN